MCDWGTFLGELWRKLTFGAHDDVPQTGISVNFAVFVRIVVALMRPNRKFLPFRFPKCTPFVNSRQPSKTHAPDRDLRHSAQHNSTPIPHLTPAITT